MFIFAKKINIMSNLKTFFIYKIISPVNEVYIGQTIDVNHRFSGYKSVGARGQSKLNFSFLKYGWINHTFEILLEIQCTQFEIDKIEQSYIQEYKNKNNSLNIAFGGRRGNKGVSRGKGIDSPLSKKIYQYDLEGNFLKEFNSYTEASKESGATMTQLCKCILNKTRYAGKFLWLNENEYKNNVSLERKNNTMIPCVQLDKKGNFIAFHDSITTAIRKNTLKCYHIHDCISGKRKTSGGFKWMSKNEYLKLIKNCNDTNFSITELLEQTVLQEV